MVSAVARIDEGLSQLVELKGSKLKILGYRMVGYLRMKGYTARQDSKWM